MKYTVITKVNGRIVDKHNLIADSPKSAVLSSINYLIKAKRIEMVEVYVNNIQGSKWYYLININHKNRKLRIVREQKLK